MKKNLFLLISLFLIFPHKSFSKDENKFTYQDWQERMRKHPFLLYENFMYSTPLRKLNDNRWIYLIESGENIEDEKDGKYYYSIDKQDVYISPCISKYDLNHDLSIAELSCLDSSKKEFDDNKDEKLFKVIELIYPKSHKIILEDLKNATLLKDGFHYFYIQDNYKRKKLKKNIQEKIYLGKKINYVINDYKFSIISKYFESDLNNNIKKLDDDLKLKNLLDKEESKKNVFDLENNIVLETNNTQNDITSDLVYNKNFDKDFTGLYLYGDYQKNLKESGTLSIKQLDENKIYFELVAHRGSPNNNMGFAKGELSISDGKSTHNIKDEEDKITCSLFFDFSKEDEVVLKESAYGFDCGFGNNVSVEGSYIKNKDVFYSLDYP